MRMNNCCANFILVLCLCFVLVSSESSDCKCLGPIKFYNELGCTPVFKNPGDCCPERYDCEKLKSLPSDKCIVNGHYYNIGETLREEDTDPCDIGCTCIQRTGGPMFNCAIVDCFHGPMTPGCYLKHNALQCCAGPEVCPEKDEDRATCIVDGKTYRDGEYFQPADEPNKYCYCGEGYSGKNVEPYCNTLKHSCGVLFRHANDLREHCIPTYYYNQSPQTSCSVAYRCQNDKDTVIRKTEESSETKSAPTANPDMVCTFGNLTMNIGDELNQATDYSSVCMKCVCEVPPIPTCQRLSDEDCDVTKHPKFGI